MKQAGLMFLAGCAAAVAVPIAVDAQSGGNAHRPVIGKTPVQMKYSLPYACLGQSSVTGNIAATRPDAEQSALTSWSTTYGSYGNWNLAQNRSLTCAPAPGGQRCTASGQPCTTVRNAM